MLRKVKRFLLVRIRSSLRQKGTLGEPVFWHRPSTRSPALLPATDRLCLRGWAAGQGICPWQGPPAAPHGAEVEGAGACNEQQASVGMGTPVSCGFNGAPPGHNMQPAACRQDLAKALPRSPLWAAGPSPELPA